MKKEPQSSPCKPDSAALFRYEWVSRVPAFERAGWVRPDAVKAVVEEENLDEKGRPKRVSARTLYRWIAAFEASGITVLCRKPIPSEVGAVIPEALATFLIAEKTGDPRASIPELIRRVRIEGLDGADRLDRTTVWRTFRDRGVNTRRTPKKANQRDMRRFAFAHDLLRHIMGATKMAQPF